MSLFDAEGTEDNENTLLHSQVAGFVSAPKTKLKADKINNTIEIDSNTTLEGIPPIAWEYKLGNHSALGFSTNTKNANRKTRPSPKNSILINLKITKKASLIY